MTNLLIEKCIPCNIGTKPLSSADIERYLKLLDKSWEVFENKYIKKTYLFNDFKDALKFVNSIGDLSEREGHHPEITLNWGRVIVKLMTFKIKGLHENDFILAAKIDQLYSI